MAVKQRIFWMRSSGSRWGMLHALSLAELEDDDDHDDERWAYRLSTWACICVPSRCCIGYMTMNSCPCYFGSKFQYLSHCANLLDLAIPSLGLRMNMSLLIFIDLFFSWIKTEYCIYRSFWAQHAMRINSILLYHFISYDIVFIWYLYWNHWRQKACRVWHPTKDTRWCALAKAERSFQQICSVFFQGVIDGVGIDVESLRALKKAECKVELVFHWIQSIVVTSILAFLFVSLGLMRKFRKSPVTPSTDIRGVGSVVSWSGSWSPSESCWAGASTHEVLIVGLCLHPHRSSREHTVNWRAESRRMIDDLSKSGRLWNMVC